MIKINCDIKEFVLDLNDSSYDKHQLKITSKGDSGNNLPWGIELVNNKLVHASKVGDKVIIDMDYKHLKSEALIVLRNYAKERAFIRIKPSLEAIEEKTYKFEITDSIIDDGILTFKLVSTVNDRNIPWKCTYLGNPMTYGISKTDGDGTCEITIKLLTELVTDFPSKIIFEQEDSGNYIELSLINGKEGIKKAD